VVHCASGFLSKRNLKRGSWKGKTFSAPHFLHLAWYESAVGRVSMSQWWATVHGSKGSAPLARGKPVSRVTEFCPRKEERAGLPALSWLRSTSHPAGTNLGVAVATVNRPASSGLKWHFCLLAAFGTHYGEHLPPGRAVA